MLTNFRGFQSSQQAGFNTDVNVLQFSRILGLRVGFSKENY